MKILFLVLGVLLLACNSNNIDAHTKNVLSQNETKEVFSYDSMSDIWNLISEEVGDLPLESNQATYCEWMKNYRESIYENVTSKSNLTKDDFEVVGYVEFSKNEYYVKYGDDCKLVSADEISLRIVNLFHGVSACVKREENEFEPNYTNTTSKKFANNNGIQAYVQVWYNE